MEQDKANEQENSKEVITEAAPPTSDGGDEQQSNVAGDQDSQGVGKKLLL